jgi:biopolymer transport protein TolQ
MMGEHSALDLVLGASFAVQCVLALLAAASVVSWGIIFRKRSVLAEARGTADAFEEQFWSGGDLASLYKQYEGGAPVGMTGVFVAGFRSCGKRTAWSRTCRRSPPSARPVPMSASLARCGES